MCVLQAISDYKDGLSIAKSALNNKMAKTTLQRRLKRLGITRKYTKRINVVPELAGRQFGTLTAIEYVVEQEGRVLWLCECGCGLKQKFRQSDLLEDRRSTCGNCRMTREGNPRWKGCGELSGTRWKHIRNGARRKTRTLSFEITIEYAWDLYRNQDGKCALSGMPIPFPDKVTERSMPSLDRIDSALGYVEGNVQWLHKDVNKMKWDLDQSRFVEICSLIVLNGG